MKLKLTLVRPGNDSVDLTVTADGATSVSDLARELADRDPRRDHASIVSAEPKLRIAHGGRPGPIIDGRLEVAEAQLASGSFVTLERSDSYSPSPPARSQPAATMTVVGGPGGRARFELRPGSVVVGRDSSCDIQLTDSLVSKQHARIDVVEGLVRVVDLNSANGIIVDGQVVSRAELVDGQAFTLGDTELRIALTATTALVDERQVVAKVHLRAPRVEARYPGSEFVAPELPSQVDAQPFPWLAMIAPLLMGGVLFAFTRSPLTLVFVALSPVLLLGNFITSSLARKRKRKDELEKFKGQLATLAGQLRDEVEPERLSRLAEHPSTLEVLDGARSRGSLLWTRRPEHWTFLSLRLGVGTLPSRNTVEVTGEESALPEYAAELGELVSQYRDIAGVPVAESLYSSGGLGIAGPAGSAFGVTRALIAQLCGLHSPTEVVVCSIIGPRAKPDFEWLKWLPHSSSLHSPVSAQPLVSTAQGASALLSDLEELIALRSSTARPVSRGAGGANASALEAGGAVSRDPGSVPAPPAPFPAVILVITMDAPVDLARLIQAAERAADTGVYPIWVANSESGLPAVARTFLTLDGTGSAVAGYVRTGQRVSGVDVETLSPEEAMAFARGLAPVVDASSKVEDASDLPRSVGLLTLLGNDLARRPSAAIERWNENESIYNRASVAMIKPRRPGRLRAIVGQSSLDAMHLDLRAQGPHALVGGTTGSGKSEFLQAWVLALAAEYSPDRVTFLFVDYKGGSAFADCVNLPHSVGIVTDLSPHLVRRALTSLRAELHHRERLLARKGAKDLLEMERRGDPDSPPALVIVIDEFAALVGDVPQFVDGVVDIAQRGRSLGIHLILATQRPAGVIRDNLRANTNLRIALRMADEHDSTDVVGEPVAATFDPTIPGRGIVKTGPGRLTGFQSAYAGGWTNSEKAPVTIGIQELDLASQLTWDAPEAVVSTEDPGPTDQELIVANLVAAAQIATVPAPRRPWLEMLPPIFDLTKLRQRSDTELMLGVADIPERQAQNPVFFSPDTDGSIAIYGTGGSGKSVALRTLAVAAGITPRGGPADVYGLDFANGGLTLLEQLPHVGSIVSSDDPDRVVRLLRFLRQMLDSRAARYPGAQAGNIAEYRANKGQADERRILLLVDGFPAFRQEFEIPAARAPWYRVLAQLISEGRQFGIHVALTADRPASVPGSIGSSIQRRVVLRLAEDSAYSLLDVPNDILSAASPPGRAIIDGFETQIALVGAKASVPEQFKAIAGIAQAMQRAGRTPAPPVLGMPNEVQQDSLPDSVFGLPTLGISEETLEPMGFEPSGVLLVAGPPNSGRSTALEAMLVAVDRAEPSSRFFYFGNPRSTLVTKRVWLETATSPEEVVALAKRLAAELVVESRKTVVVIESVSDFLSTPADSPIVELTKAIKRTSHLLVAESESANWGSSWPLLAEIKAARRGLLLQPENFEGESLLKVSLPRGSRADFPAGRGYFVEKGRAVRVQMPLPVPDSQ